MQLSRCVGVGVGVGVGVVVDLVTLSVEIQTAGWPDLLLTGRHSQSWPAGGWMITTRQHNTIPTVEMRD